MVIIPAILGNGNGDVAFVTHFHLSAQKMMHLRVFMTLLQNTETLWLIITSLLFCYLARKDGTHKLFISSSKLLKVVRYRRE